MKVYFYYLKGPQINDQQGIERSFFGFGSFKYRTLIRIWRFQIVIDYNKLVNRWKQK